MATEKDAWMQEAYEAAAKDQPMVHRERFAFNYGVHMGIEIAKLKTIDKYNWILEKMLAKCDRMNLTVEIQMLKHLIDVQFQLGDMEIEKDKNG